MSQVFEYRAHISVGGKLVQFPFFSGEPLTEQEAETVGEAIAEGMNRSLKYIYTTEVSNEPAS